MPTAPVVTALLCALLFSCAPPSPPPTSPPSAVATLPPAQATPSRIESSLQPPPPTPPLPGRPYDHCGSIKPFSAAPWTVEVDRWRSSIEGYLPAVRPDNQALLGAPTYRAFAQYLNAMHNRLHPVFADSFLGSLEQLPCDNPLSDPKLATELEIVVAPDGHIARIGVVKPSGMTTFDVGTLVAVRRAAPFEPTPPAIQSTDGNLYLRWKFQRDEVFSCTTMNARPFRLNSTSTTP